MEEKKNYPFEFSVVMAVYNVEPFLREAVESLIAQDFGFEKIQLIMVDDGSTDGSGAICDEYAAQYPENVLVIHKENGGVSSARNEGLKHIQGRYINFLDSDDKFSSDTFSFVHHFFIHNEDDTDVVAVPRFYFDGKTGKHDLNYRFRKGTQLINLRRDYTAIQNTSSTAFFTRTGIEGISYETGLSYCEDTLFVCMVLLKKMTIGVVDAGAHYTRKRITGELSATQKMEDDKSFYIDTMEHLTKRMIYTCMKDYGYVPRFVQFLLANELQWKLIAQRPLCPPLSETEAAKYLDDIHEVLQFIDDEIIFAQKKMNQEFKIFCLERKYGKEPEWFCRGNDILFHYGNCDLAYLSTIKCFLDFLTIEKGKLIVDGYILCPILKLNIEVGLVIDGNFHICKEVQRHEEKYSFGIPIRKAFGFKSEICLSDLEKKETTIQICCRINDMIVVMQNIVSGPYTAVSAKLQNAYFYSDGWTLHFVNNAIVVKPSTPKGRFHKELKLLYELWKRNKVGSRKAILARIAYHFAKLFKRKEIWLVSDRIDKAGDNGQAFFTYLTKRERQSYKAYFVINRGTESERELKQNGGVVSPSSWRYKLLFLLADKIISSHVDDVVIRPFRGYEQYYQDIAATHKFVYLQHGVIKDDLSKLLGRYQQNIHLFISVTQPEYDSIMTYPYYYDDTMLKITGFPRYDLLYHDEKKYITIMPTWRAYLVGGIDPKTGKRPLKAGFEESHYYQIYKKLLNCDKLFDAAEKMGYQIRFLNHPNMSATANMIPANAKLVYLSDDTAYRTIFAESDLILTDFSSIAFDFAYLRKPVIYYQEDIAEFYSGAHTYDKGYFEYERDGFGEVIFETDKLVDCLIEYMENGCQLKEKYRARIDATFPFSDQNNCQRVYEKIIKMDKQD